MHNNPSLAPHGHGNIPHSLTRLGYTVLIEMIFFLIHYVGYRLCNHLFKRFFLFNGATGRKNDLLRLLDEIFMMISLILFLTVASYGRPPLLTWINFSPNIDK